MSSYEEEPDITEDDMSGDESKDVRPAYSPGHPLYAQADLIVKSCDNVVFATRAIHLRSASSVFDGILGLPHNNNARNRLDGRPLIKIAEDAEAFELFLTYADRDCVTALDETPQPSWDLVFRVSTLMFDKYDAPLLGRLFLHEQLPRFVGESRPPKRKSRSGQNNSLEVFAVSTIYGLEDMAKLALEAFNGWGYRNPSLRSLNHKDLNEQGKIESGWRPKGLGDLSLDLLSRMSYEHIHQFSRLHSKVLSTPGYTWYKAAEDFKL